MASSYVRIAVSAIALLMGTSLARSDQNDAENLFLTEAAARWAYLNCPMIKISPMVLMLAGMVQKKASPDQLTASHVKFDALMTSKFTNISDGCDSLAPLLLGPKTK